MWGYVILKMSKRAEVVCDKSKNIKVKKWNLWSDIVKRYPFSKFKNIKARQKMGKSQCLKNDKNKKSKIN